MRLIEPPANPFDAASVRAHLAWLDTMPPSDARAGAIARWSRVLAVLERDRP